MAITPRPFTAPAAHPPQVAAAPLRRCTFRRVTTIEKPRALPVYQVACTFPDRRAVVSLGDVESARPVCEACTYSGIFRPDSD
jgi:hypothetical protein